MENSQNGRIDFPEVGRSDENNLISGSVELEYSNSNENPVTMQLWIESPLNAIELEFPPTGGDWWRRIIDLREAHQFSITAADANGSISIRDVTYTWKTYSGFDNLIEIGECPIHPLPGIGDANPQPPTAHTKARTGACLPWQGFYGLDTSVLGSIVFDASDSTDANIEPLNYFWDFQDGSTAEGAQVSHAFAEAGFYFVSLTATDPSGRSDKDIIRIDVQGDNPSNKSPVPVITANRTNLLRPFASTTLWGDVSYDQDGDPVDHVWYNEFTEEVVRGPEINLDLAGYSSAWLDIFFGVSDGRGGINDRRQRVSVADYPGQDCEVTYKTTVYPRFSMEVKIYNNTSMPVQNWLASWHTDAVLTSLNLNTNNPYLFNLSGAQSFSVSGDHIPEYSWVSFNLYGESAAEIQEIGFKPQNGMKCIEHMVPRPKPN